MIDIKNIPMCFDKVEYVKGYEDCYKNDPVPLHDMNDSWMAGYSYAYTEQQMETARSLGNVHN